MNSCQSLSPCPSMTQASGPLLLTPNLHPLLSKLLSPLPGTQGLSRGCFSWWRARGPAPENFSEDLSTRLSL